MGSGQHAESKVVVSWRFSWEAVKPSLARALCVAAYSEKGQTRDVERILVLQDAVIAAQAAKVLGSPPGPGHKDVLAPVLRDEWLPTLTRAQLEPIAALVQLGLTGRERNAELGTKAQMLDFLSRRRVTDHLGFVLRKAFIDAHKVAVEHEAGVAPPAAPSKWGRIVLRGQGSPDRREPYAHQRQAWQRLNDMCAATSRQDRAGLLILPTGAGKTYTMVHWLIQRLTGEPDLRVLWLADQQELVDQAAHAFVDHASVLPVGRRRTMRVVHGGGDPASALAHPELDVVCATRQSVTGAGFAEPSRKRLEAFLSRPCVVVVDEAHHAVSPTYRRLLDFIIEKAPSTMLVGLTATPWPKGAAMTARLRERFPVRIADVETRDLVKAGVLATPRLHTVDTHELVKLTPDEAKQIAGRDVPASVLRDLDRESRNRLIVNAWLSRQDEWGKTLVFACDIAHAVRLGALFAAEQVTTEVLHSRSEEHRTQVLERFRKSTGSSVLVSVGMLLEGVDVPDARTAFLARPTSSRIVLRQMIGRVLRGVAGGGEAEAHIVDLRDRWTADVDVLSPVELPGLDPNPDESDADRGLPPVLDERSGEAIPADVLYRITKAYEQLTNGIPCMPTLSSTELVGFYELGYLNVPVFAHSQDRWQRVIDAELSDEPYLRPVEMFDDLPIPQPVVSDVKAVVEFCRSERVAPPLVKVQSVLSLHRIIGELREAGPLSEDERLKLLRQAYESSLARMAYGSFWLFYDAVNQESARQSEVPNRSNPECVVNADHARSTTLPQLVRRSDRDLREPLKRVASQGRQILREHAPELEGLLKPALLPPVAWTRYPVVGAWAYWHAQLHGKGKGRPVIEVNCVLQALRTQISDELLEYLLWHELVHHVLPGRGHDGEFRRLECLWPDFARLDHELDTLDERFDMSKAFARQ